MLKLLLPPRMLSRRRRRQPKCEADLQAQYVIVPPVDEARVVWLVSCPICKETLKSEFLQDDEDWVWKDAIKKDDILLCPNLDKGVDISCDLSMLSCSDSRIDEHLCSEATDWEIKQQSSWYSWSTINISYSFRIAVPPADITEGIEISITITRL